MAEKSVVLFDGVCNLCNGFVNFLIVRDPHNKLQFGSLQSAGAQDLLKKFHYSANDLSTVLLVQNNQLYSQSTAVLKIFQKMPGPWPILYAFIVVPKPLRDFLYNLIAKNRYKIFGRKDTCRIPTPELQSKFVD